MTSRLGRRVGPAARALALVVAVVGCHGKQEADPDRAFWSWFVAHAPALAKNPQLIDVMQQVQHELGRQHRGVIVEVGSAGSDHLLVLSADGNRELFPEVQRLYAAHPDVNGWKIVAFRPRDAKRPMRPIEIGDRTLDPATLRYASARNDGKLDLQLGIPGYVETDTRLGMMAFLALDHTVGEYDVETKLGAIELVPIERLGATSHALEDLPGELDAIAF